MAPILFYRVAFAGILCMAYFSTVIELKHAIFTDERSSYSRQPMSRFYNQRVSPLIKHLIFCISLVLFSLHILPLLAILLISIEFIATCSRYLSSDNAGYVVINSAGKPERHVFHHLHLCGITLIGALLAEMVQFAAAHTSYPGYLHIPETGLFVPFIRVCIGAHYFMAGFEKIRKQKLYWPSKRLFPFYLHLTKLYHFGDYGKNKESGMEDHLGKPAFLGITLLWLALLIELSAVFYPFSYNLRPYIGSALLTMHATCFFVFKIDFRENVLLLLVFSYNYFGQSFNIC
jgi:hypothetical protein